MLRIFQRALEIGVSIVVICGGFMACANPESTNPEMPYLASTASQDAIRRERIRESVHSRNAQEWVGVSHNAALDAFREEFRQPGRMKNLCSRLAQFALAPERMPASKRVHVRSDTEAQHRVRKAICPNRIPFSNVSYPAVLQSEDFLTPTAQTLLSRIDEAIAGSANPSDLAERLAPILAEANALGGVEQAIVGGAISIAQNSLEYWTAAWPAFTEEVRLEYAGCLDASRSIDDSFELCTENSLVIAPFHQFQRGTAVSAIACSPTSAWDGIKQTAKGDFGGFVTGAVAAAVGIGLKGAAVSLPVAGEIVLVAGTASGIGKSAYEGARVTYSLFRCAMGWGENVQKT